MFDLVWCEKSLWVYGLLSCEFLFRVNLSLLDYIAEFVVLIYLTVLPDNLVGLRIRIDCSRFGNVGCEI